MRKSNLTELLRRWVQGEANRRDEAELEQAARSDEWLADAMEGYRSRPEADHAQRLTRMRAQMAARTRRRMRPVWMRVAAALALVAVVGLALRLALGGRPDAGLAQTETGAAGNGAATALERAAAEEDAPPTAALPAPPAATQRRADSGPARDAAPAAGTAVMAPPAPETATALAADDGPEEGPTLAEEAPVTADVVTNSRSERAKTAAPPAVAAPLAQPGGAPFSRLPNSRQLSGQVTDSNGEPLIGAMVAAAGSQAGAITDIDGRFRLQVDSSVLQLVVSYTGFAAQTVNVPANRDQLSIRLEESANALSEVVVMGRQPQRRKAEQSSSALTTADSQAVINQATPEGGLRRFERYVRDAWPAGTPNGRATLRFDLDGNGRPVNIVVTSRTDEAVAAAAINILRNGPRWQIANGQAGSQISHTFVR